MGEQETNNQVAPEQGLKKSLKFSYVFALATGSIFTFIGYWDSMFFRYCGPGTFLAFLLMSALILPIAFVYCELAPLFPSCGGELIYNTVGLNKHFGFLSAWLIMAAWIAVPPAAVMAIVQWIYGIFGATPELWVLILISIALLVCYCFMSLQSVEIAGKAQIVMLVLAIAGCVVSSIAFMCSGHWSFDNFKDFFVNENKDLYGATIPEWFGWIIGMALLITPFFGFETVPQMVEEANFPVKKSTVAIWGSVVTCGVIYAFFFFGIAGMDWKPVLEGPAQEGYLAIYIMKSLGGGWNAFAIVFGIAAILCAIGTCLLGFWLSTVRLLYAMGKQNFLPKSFAKLNKHQQPILPNIVLLVVSVIFLLLQFIPGSFMQNFFNLMAFGCAVAYAITMISAIRIHKNHPEWKSDYHLKGGNITRVAALIISIIVAVFCALGQGWQSWLCFGIWFLIGVALWAWMVFFKWKKEKVIIETPSGLKEF